MVLEGLGGQPSRSLGGEIKLQSAKEVRLKEQIHIAVSGKMSKKKHKSPSWGEAFKI